MTYYRVDYQVDGYEPTYQVIKADDGPAALKKVIADMDSRGCVINDIYWQEASLDEAIEASNISGAFWR